MVFTFQGWIPGLSTMLGPQLAPGARMKDSGPSSLGPVEGRPRPVLLAHLPSTPNNPDARRALAGSKASGQTPGHPIASAQLQFSIHSGKNRLPVPDPMGCLLCPRKTVLRKVVPSNTCPKNRNQKPILDRRPAHGVGRAAGPQNLLATLPFIARVSKGPQFLFLDSSSWMPPR